MASSPLVAFRRFLHRHFVVNGVRIYYNSVWKTKIGAGSRISLSVKIDKANPEGVVIGKNTAVTFGVAIVTHDFVNNFHTTTTIGSNCFIGANAIIMPGVTIGDQCIIGAGSVVLRDVPAHSVVMGNPGRVIERDIKLGPWGVRIAAPKAENIAKIAPEAVVAVAARESLID